MAFFDLPLTELGNYKSSVTCPKDFADFWLETMAESTKKSRKPSFTRTAEYLTGIEAYDLEFSGYNGERIKGWYLVPAKKLRGNAKIPCIVEFIGYGGGRGHVQSWTVWPSAGFAILVMDTRGQGSTWSPGDTADRDGVSTHPQHPGYMTRGILNKTSYYYRRVFADAVHAVETAATRTEVDTGRIILTGGSQGGGITIAANSILSMQKAKNQNKVEVPLGIMPDVPFLCDYKRATSITNGYPYQEIVAYLKIHREDITKVFETLDYFDGVNFSAQVKNAALFSVALMDDICPPSTVFGAFNAMPSKQKSIEVYQYNGHEGGSAFQEVKKIHFARALAGLA